MKKGKSLAFGIALLALSALLLVGLCTFLAPCGPKEDGSWMNCHWAGVAVTCLAGLLTLFSLGRVVIPSAKIGAGLSLAAVPTALLAAVLPGNLIPLCGMTTMHCQAVTRPGALVLGILIAAVALADALLNRKDA